MRLRRRRGPQRALTMKEALMARRLERLGEWSLAAAFRADPDDDVTRLRCCVQVKRAGSAGGLETICPPKGSVPRSVMEKLERGMPPRDDAVGRQLGEDRLGDI